MCGSGQPRRSAHSRARSRAAHSCVPTISAATLSRRCAARAGCGLLVQPHRLPHRERQRALDRVSSARRHIHHLPSLSLRSSCRWRLRFPSCADRAAASSGLMIGQQLLQLRHLRRVLSAMFVFSVGSIERSNSHVFAGLSETCSFQSPWRTGLGSTRSARRSRHVALLPGWPLQLRRAGRLTPSISTPAGMVPPPAAENVGIRSI